MDFTHLALAGLLLAAVAIALGGFRSMSRLLERDHAVDAATFLALRDLRDWLERNPPASGRRS